MEVEPNAAEKAAFTRAFCAENAPVFRDPKARGLFTDAEYAALTEALQPEPDAPENFLHAYGEAAIQTAMRTGTGQAALLSCGWDTFPFRNPGFCRRFPVYAVDAPETLDAYCMRILRAGWKLPEGYAMVPAALTDPQLGKRLENAGWDRTRKGIFLLPNVSFSLYKTELSALLRQLAEISSAGTGLILDYADEGFPLSDDPREQGREVRACYDAFAMEMLLGDAGFPVYETLNARQMRAQIAENAAPYAHIHIIQAAFRG